MNETTPEPPELLALRAAGAAKVDAVGWHYIETLARRSQAHSGSAQLLLQAKLKEALLQFETRRKKGAQHARPTPVPVVLSPLALLLQEIGPKNALQATGNTSRWQTENPRIEQFRQQLSRISVQKQVSQAIAQAPQNAGPINSHMLVLRSLGLMRELSTDYLNRFMAHVDTMMCLEEADQRKVKTHKATASARARP